MPRWVFWLVLAGLAGAVAVGAEAPTEQAVADQLTSLQKDVEVLGDETSDALVDLRDRVRALERMPRPPRR